MVIYRPHKKQNKARRQKEGLCLKGGKKNCGVLVKRDKARDVAYGIKDGGIR